MPNWEPCTEVSHLIQCLQNPSGCTLHSQPQNIELKFYNMKPVGMKKYKTFIIRLQSNSHGIIFSQSFRGNYKGYFFPDCTFNDWTEFPIDFFLYKKKLFGEKMITKEEIDLRPLYEAEPKPVFDDLGRQSQQIAVNVPIDEGKSTANVTITFQVDAQIAEYNFQVQPEKVFTECDHPSLILSSPGLMLSPGDLAKPSVPCDSSAHPLFDWTGNQVFSCRVVHSSDALLSAAEIIDVHGKWWQQPTPSTQVAAGKRRRPRP